MLLSFGIFFFFQGCALVSFQQANTISFLNVLSHTIEFCFYMNTGGLVSPRLIFLLWVTHCGYNGYNVHPRTGVTLRCVQLSTFSSIPSDDNGPKKLHCTRMYECKTFTAIQTIYDIGFFIYLFVFKTGIRRKFYRSYNTVCQTLEWDIVHYCCSDITTTRAVCV